MSSSILTLCLLEDGVPYLAQGLSLRMSSSTLTLPLMEWMEYPTWPRDPP